MKKQLLSDAPRYSIFWHCRRAGPAIALSRPGRCQLMGIAKFERAYQTAV
jgi:hypothetical protein